MNKFYTDQLMPDNKNSLWKSVVELSGVSRSTYGLHWLSRSEKNQESAWNRHLSQKKKNTRKVFSEWTIWMIQKMKFTTPHDEQNKQTKKTEPLNASSMTSALTSIATGRGKAALHRLHSETVCASQGHPGPSTEFLHNTALESGTWGGEHHETEACSQQHAYQSQRKTIHSFSTMKRYCIYNQKLYD